MITERLTFQAKYGHGDELVAIFKESFELMTAGSGIRGARIYTDATGRMFTVVVEMDYDDMSALAAANAQESSQYGDASFQEWFDRMMAVTEHGERQLYNCEKLL